jgi:hypothetical protein
MTKTKKNQPKEVVDSVQETTQDATNQGAPFEENVPAPEPELKEEVIEEEEIPEPEPKEEITKEDFELDEVLDDDDFEESPEENLPSLDEIKAKERALRKR